MKLWYPGKREGDCPFCAGVFDEGICDDCGGVLVPEGIAAHKQRQPIMASWNWASFTISNNIAFPSTSWIGFDAAPDPDLDLDLTFGTECLVAWRSWSLQQFKRRDGTSEARLGPIGVAATRTTVWEPRERVEATCTVRLHDAPDLGCHCGLWALPQRGDINEAREAVFGSVYLWGRVIEFKRGYRAQYAYPKEIWMRDAKAAAELRELYGVPVEVVA